MIIISAESRARHIVFGWILGPVSLYGERGGRRKRRSKLREGDEIRRRRRRIMLEYSAYRLSSFRNGELGILFLVGS